MKILIEVTLALLLFADSSTLDLHQLKVDARLPARLIVLALPLVIFLGGLLAFALFPQEGIGFALLMGAILAPTDAALGLPIFTNERVPVRIRRALNVESGLNDGIATPFVTLFTALAVAEVTQKLTGWLASAVIDIVIAVAVGADLGMSGGWLFAVAMRRRLTSRATEQIGSRGGMTTWENIVCACLECNRLKGGHTPEEAGMRLRRKPRRPAWTPFVARTLAGTCYREWRPFLGGLDGAYWNVELEA